MHALSVVLALAISASAYQVTQPNSAQGWTNEGPQTVAWVRVDTDPRNFTIVLTSLDGNTNQVLVAEQDGVNQQSVACNPPSAGWPLGSDFRVNLVESTVDQNTIYAQSDKFEIKLPNVTTSGTLTSSLTVSRPTTPLAPPVTSNSPTTATTGGSSSTPTSGSSVIKGSIGLMIVLSAVTLFAA